MNEKDISKELKIGNSIFKLYNIFKCPFEEAVYFSYFYECNGLLIVYDEKIAKWRFGYLVEGDYIRYVSSDFNSMDKKTWVEALYNNYEDLKQKFTTQLELDKSRIETLEDIYKICKEEINIKDIIE